MRGNVNGKRKDKQPETCHSTSSGDAHGGTDDWILGNDRICFHKLLLATRKNKRGNNLKIWQKETFS